MKKSIIFMGVMLLFAVPFKSLAQATVEKDADTYNFIYYEPINNNEKYKWVTPCGSSHTTITPSGNIVKYVYFQLQDDHPLMGQNFIFAARIKLENGTYLVDERVKLNSDGRFKITVHLNGAGTNLPVGWQ